MASEESHGGPSRKAKRSQEEAFLSGQGEDPTPPAKRSRLSRPSASQQYNEEYAEEYEGEEYAGEEYEGEEYAGEGYAGEEYAGEEYEGEEYEGGEYDGEEYGEEYDEEYGEEYEEEYDEEYDEEVKERTRPALGASKSGQLPTLHPTLHPTPLSTPLPVLPSPRTTTTPAGRATPQSQAATVGRASVSSTSTSTTTATISTLASSSATTRGIGASRVPPPRFVPVLSPSPAPAKRKALSTPTRPVEAETEAEVFREPAPSAEVAMAVELTASGRPRRTSRNSHNAAPADPPPKQTSAPKTLVDLMRDRKSGVLSASMLREMEERKQQRIAKKREAEQAHTQEEASEEDGEAEPSAPGPDTARARPAKAAGTRQPSRSAPPAVEAEDEEKLRLAVPRAAPRIAIVNGQITIDQSSLVQAAPRAEPIHHRSVVVEDGRRHITSASFRKNPTTRKWNEDDKARFTLALQKCGTDFTMIEKFFPTRTRSQIRNYFKKLEKTHPDEINKALANRMPLTLEEFRETNQKFEEAKRAKEDRGLEDRDPENRGLEPAEEPTLALPPQTFTSATSPAAVTTTTTRTTTTTTSIEPNEEEEEIDETLLAPRLRAHRPSDGESDYHDED